MTYQELDCQDTPIGQLMLRKRRMSQFGDFDIYEVKLGDEFLMTNLFHESETQLATKSLAEISGDKLDVVVGGLGLGYTAVAALEDKRVEKLTVIEFLEPVINWHKNNIVPLGQTLCADHRCTFKHQDFFEFAKEKPTDKFDAILLDIDHTPTNVLHQTNTRFYSIEGLTELSLHLKPQGVFGLWADGKPQNDFLDTLNKVFFTANSYLIEFDNPITKKNSHGTVYVAKVD